MPGRIVALRPMTRARGRLGGGEIRTEALGVGSDQRQSGEVIDALRMCASAPSLLRMASERNLVARMSPTDAKQPGGPALGGALLCGWRMPNRRDTRVVAGAVASSGLRPSREVANCLRPEPASGCFEGALRCGPWGEQLEACSARPLRQRGGWRLIATGDDSKITRVSRACQEGRSTSAPFDVPTATGTLRNPNKSVCGARYVPTFHDLNLRANTVPDCSGPAAESTARSGLRLGYSSAPRHSFDSADDNGIVVG